MKKREKLKKLESLAETSLRGITEILGDFVLCLGFASYTAMATEELKLDMIKPLYMRPVDKKLFFLLSNASLRIRY